MLKLIAFIFTNMIFAQGMSTQSPAPSLIEICKKTECRPDTPVTLKTDKGDWSALIPSSPVVLDDMINLIPGEEMYFSFNVKNKKLVNLKRIKKDFGYALYVKFEQSKESPMMVLTVKSPLKDKKLKFHIAITPVGKSNFVKTSSCPVRPQNSLFESWPYPIARLLIVDFRLVDNGDEIKCEY